VIAIPTSVGCVQKKVEVFSDNTDRHRGWLGVEVQDVTPKLEKKKNLSVHEGAYVVEVIEDSPAEKAGIEEGDVIVKFDGKDIDNRDDLIRAVRRTKPKTNVSIEFYRKDEKRTVTVTLGKMPRSREFTFITPPDISLPKVYPFNFHIFFENEIFGMKVQTLNKQLAEYFEIPGKKGVLVTEVKKNSIGGKAGFKAGDVIVKVDKEEVEDTEDLREKLYERDSDNESEFEVIRKGKSVILQMRLEEEEEDEYSFLESLPLIEHIPFCRTRDIHLDEWHHPFQRLKDRMETREEKLQESIQSYLESLHTKA
jgi:S1-C subfamily serine protease